MAQAAASVTNTEELAKIAQNAQEILAQAETFFPFTIFPDTVVIDRVKVTVKRRDFLHSAKITSIQIEDIFNAEVNIGPLFSALLLWTRLFADKPIVINKLRNDDALKLKRILQGFIIARQKEIDCSGISRDELVNLLHKLGKEAVH